VSSKTKKTAIKQQRIQAQAVFTLSTKESNKQPTINNKESNKRVLEEQGTRVSRARE
jgi:hypothetical protein